MYAHKRLELNVPVDGRPVGCDLVAKDWIAPYGQGTNTDFTFKLSRRVADGGDYGGELQLTFSHPGDGIQQGPVERFDRGSELHSSQVAPVEGYQPMLSLLQGRVPQSNGDGSTSFQTSTDKDNYLFRVRTVRREDGTIVSACYGKIYGPIRFDVVTPDHRPPSIVFTYYLNPDGHSRSLEFDPKRNLFTNLASFERPSAP